MGMKLPNYHNPARATINLALLWHSVVDEIADLNLKIVNGDINKHVKSCHLANPWGDKDFFMGVGYPTHDLEGYVPAYVLASSHRTYCGGPALLFCTQAP